MKKNRKAEKYGYCITSGMPESLNSIKTYKFWQEANHEIVPDNTGLIEHRMNYAHENPIRAITVSRAEDYLYNSTFDYAEVKGFVHVKTDL